MKKRRIGPLLLLAIFVGAAGYSYVQQQRSDRFDQAFAEILQTAQAKVTEVATGRDTADQFFGWLGGQGLDALKALPAPVESFQKSLLSDTENMFKGMAEMYQKDPLLAVSGDNYQNFYLAIQSTATALGQARAEPSQF